MRVFVLMSFAFALVSCGSLYNSPRVSDAPNLRVINLTAQSVQTANLTPYTPRQLPPALRQTAGTSAAQVTPVAMPVSGLASPPVPALNSTRLPPAIAATPYELGVGDVVLVSTPSPDDGLSDLPGQLTLQNNRQSYTVQSDGAITIPGVGRVMVGGLTLDAAEAELFQRLAANQLDPTFGLEIDEFNAQTVSVGGAVANPAIMPITLTPLSLNQALVRAGGVTLQDQSQGSIRLYRDGNLYQIPLLQLRANADLQQLLLQNGDSLYIDDSQQLAQAQAYFEQQITLSQTRQLARDVSLRELATEVDLRRAELQDRRDVFEAQQVLGAIPRDYVYIMGEVTQQSRFVLPFEQMATLADALFDGASGVPLDSGDASQIYVLRAQVDGTIAALRLDGRNAINFTLAPQLELRPNDIIFVAEHPVTRWGRIVGQITPSLITTGATAAAN